MGKRPLISADNHVFEPVTLWQERLPSEYRDRGPRLEPVRGLVLGLLVDGDLRALLIPLQGVVAEDHVRRHGLGDARDGGGLLRAPGAHGADALDLDRALALGGPRHLQRALEGVGGGDGEGEERLRERARV